MLVTSSFNSPLCESKYFLNDLISFDLTLPSVVLIWGSSWTLPSLYLFPSVWSIDIPNNIDVISTDSFMIVNGYDVNVSSWIESTYPWKPVETDNIRAIPIIPIEPANDTKTVLFFLVIKLLNDNPKAVRNDILVFFLLSLVYKSLVLSFPL